ncbi:MAG: dephospho-CoA kinase [Verrucomicrobiota bacterium]
MKSPSPGSAIALTGGIACGKSSVGEQLRARGWPVLDTDKVAHEAMRAGTPVYRAIVDHFGTEILDPAGDIDRSALGRIVFGNDEQRKVLNGLVHPDVRKRWKAWLAEQRAGHPAVVVEIPLLFEIGAEAAGWDAIVCVAAGRETMLDRLRKRGIEGDEALRRIESQWPVEEKMKRSDHVIVNDGSKEDLERKINEVMKDILNKEKREWPK